RIASLPEANEEELRAEDRWMLAKLARLVRDVDAGFATLRFHDIMERLYDTAWHVFCDYYVEMAKPRLGGDDPGSRDAAAHTAVTVLDTMLRLLHPFMPYVTEECAQHLPGDAATLQHTDWPEVEEMWTSAATTQAERQVDDLIELVQRVRALRQERGVPNRARHRVRVSLESVDGGLAAGDAARLLGDLVPATVVEMHDEGATDTVVAGALRAEVTIDSGAAGVASADRQLRELDAAIARLRDQLARPGFVERAPGPVVDGARRRLADAEAQAAVLRASLRKAG
ncbi:MAG TPA: class I tRNA ligase family protein, partial [Dehalococcoidia bacterium]|nr:class I tRNA ligase family protein [Dehalococcoidia bacterium]